jgi:Na+-transporting methylmalonyl-CoA/oxaloacetate decarboxylase gamma subunit
VEVAMDNWTFGITMLVVGMGGTLAALGLLSLLMNGLKKLFPFKEEQPK